MRGVIDLHTRQHSASHTPRAFGVWPQSVRVLAVKHHLQSLHIVPSLIGISLNACRYYIQYHVLIVPSTPCLSQLAPTRNEQYILCFTINLFFVSSNCLAISTLSLFHLSPLKSVCYHDSKILRRHSFYE